MAFKNSRVIMILISLVLSLFCLQEGTAGSPKVVDTILSPHDSLYCVDFVDESNGWAFGNFGLAIVTRDGGKTWKKMEIGIESAIFDCRFVDKKKGWAVGIDGVIIHTEDGEKTWIKQDSGTSNPLYGVEFNDSNHGCAVGEYSTMLKTENGGNSWNKVEVDWEELTPHLIDDIGYMEFHFFDVFFSTTENGWVCGEYGIILRTRDGGGIWERESADPRCSQLYRIFFDAFQKGWAVGQNGTLMRTIDGGQSWTPSESGTEHHLFNIFFNKEMGLIAGDGILLKSNDKGQHWQKIPVNLNTRWYSGIAPVTDNRLVLVGHRANIKIVGN